MNDTVERLIGVILDAMPDAQRELKWGRPTFTLGDDWHHWICAISASETAVKLVIHKGALLEDPLGVMEGEGRYARHIAFRSADEVDADVIVRILQEAAARQTEM